MMTKNIQPYAELVLKITLAELGVLAQRMTESKRLSAHSIQDIPITTKITSFLILIPTMIVCPCEGFIDGTFPIPFALKKP